MNGFSRNPPPNVLGTRQLDALLAEREELEWRKEASEARRRAREQGVDQADIDEAVRFVRYGE